MTVRLDKVPAALAEPAAPRTWLWLLPLPVLMALGVALTLWLGGERVAPTRFWLLALGVPALVWCGAAIVRGLVYLGELSAVEGWNEAREIDLTQKMRRGRRSQQVLAVGLYTALRDSDAQSGEAQCAALLANDASQLRAQPGWKSQGLRHSRLPLLERDEGKRQRLLERVSRALLKDLAATLANLPASSPVSLLLEIGDGVGEVIARNAWEEALADSGIRQPITQIEGTGLSAIDHWLDERIHDPALLMVVSLQIAPKQVEGSAEAAVGLLFGNRLTQDKLPPRAYLHRPEPVRGATKAAVQQASGQALDWVPVPAASIGRVWLVGNDTARNAAIASVIEGVALPAKAVHNLGDLLGNPGAAGPWVAIAAAVEAMAEKAEPQFIFTGDSAQDAWMWCSVVMPAVAPQGVGKSDA